MKRMATGALTLLAAAVLCVSGCQSAKGKPMALTGQAERTTELKSHQTAKGQRYHRVDNK